MQKKPVFCSSRGTTTFWAAIAVATGLMVGVPTAADALSRNGAPRRLQTHKRGASSTTTTTALSRRRGGSPGVRGRLPTLRQNDRNTRHADGFSNRLAHLLNEGQVVEPHLHFEAAIRGARLWNLAERHGDVKAGLRALGLSDAPEDLQVSGLRARQMMDLSRNPIDVVYPALALFRGAAFATDAQYAELVRGSADAMRGSADVTFVQIRPARLARVLRVAREHNVNLRGVRFMLGVHRTRGLDAQERELISSLLTEYPEAVAGLDLLGEETTEQRPEQIEEMLDLIAGSRRGDLVLRLHEGEGLDNPNTHPAIANNAAIAARTMRRYVQRNGHRRLQVILAHATHVNVPRDVEDDMVALRDLGVAAYLNPNPFANMMYGSVVDVHEIQAARITNVPILVGTDNVGNVRDNLEAWRRVQSGDHAWLAQRLRFYAAIAVNRRANPQQGASAPPPAVK